MHSTPARYLILIDASGAMTARLFDAERRPLGEFDASSEEVAVMTQGLVAAGGADTSLWDQALAGHNATERREAEIFTLDI
ncbi:hypothetical protein HZ992_11600 [Rhizobacter sp. AJA081-3]|uniref:hypothetical protein n=1 Tax=Rhizobacter sp. AJA081-3 TaxID=2753607 RepID=UPI001ADFA365|nr:hypothetical protein [Rhizobacter sp. AJA081-3]QTN25553.1 hypothetical protein HZ992_11600 [Rhizobacter sp. AJA081-3]